MNNTLSLEITQPGLGDESVRVLAELVHEETLEIVR